MKLNTRQQEFQSLQERIAYKRRIYEKAIESKRRIENVEKTVSVFVSYCLPVLVITSLILLVILISSCSNAHAGQIPENLAVRAIVGEGASEGLDGMRCLASAIRNRGTLKGVYGLHAKHIKSQPKWVWKLARMAWRDSAKYDYADKCSHWEGTAFKTPYWAKKMVLVKTVKNQRFYRVKPRG